MLLDQFRPPVSVRKPWEGFHTQWVGEIARHLNEAVLPGRFECEPTAHLGDRAAVHVGAFEDEDWSPIAGPAGGNGAAVRPLTYAPPAPPLSAAVAFTDPDVFEVRVYRDANRWRLAAASELVSPANKDRPAHRRAFAVKCASYLQSRVAVVVVDVVTERSADMHDELLDVLQRPEGLSGSSPAGLAAVAYRTIRPAGASADRLDIWPHALAVGDPLPVVPLCLAADLAVPLDLAATYAAACRALRLAA